MTCLASRSFGLMRFSALEISMAISCSRPDMTQLWEEEGIGGEGQAMGEWHSDREWQSD